MKGIVQLGAVYRCCLNRISPQVTVSIKSVVAFLLLSSSGHSPEKLMHNPLRQCWH